MKKIFKYLMCFICAITVVSGCSCKKEEDTKASLQVGDMNATTYKDITLDEYETKISDKDSFVLFIYSNTCSACKAFKPVLNGVIKERHLIIYGLEYGLITSDSSISKIKYTPTIIIYDKGERIFQTLTDEDYDYLESKSTFLSLLDKYTYMPTLYYINKEQLVNKINSNEKFIIYYSWNLCGDCSYLNKNYMKEFLNNNPDTKHFYIIETNAKGIRLDEEGKSDANMWQEFKDTFGLSSKNNPLGHGAGYVPTLQYYENGEIKDMMVYFNDYNTTRTDSDLGVFYMTIDNSYYDDNPYIGQELSYSDYFDKMPAFYDSKLKTFLDTNLVKVD